MTDHRHTNRLVHETSPYLRQHAHNPVDWYAWGEDALEKARREGKSPPRGQADPPVHRLFGLSLVSRHGARILRGRSDCPSDERPVRQHQSRPRGTARSRQDLPGCLSVVAPAGRRLAADSVSGPRRSNAVRRRNLFPQNTPLRNAGLHRCFAPGQRPLSPEPARPDLAKTSAFGSVAHRNRRCAPKSPHRPPTCPT